MFDFKYSAKVLIDRKRWELSEKLFNLAEKLDQKVRNPLWTAEERFFRKLPLPSTMVHYLEGLIRTVAWDVGPQPCSECECYPCQCERTREEERFQKEYKTAKETWLTTESVDDLLVSDEIEPCSLEEARQDFESAPCHTTARFYRSTAYHQLNYEVTLEQLRQIFEQTAEYCP